jgi:hypothetical protein
MLRCAGGQACRRGSGRSSGRWVSASGGGRRLNSRTRNPAAISLRTAGPGNLLDGQRDNPFHVARLAGDALDRCRRRVQHDIHGHRGRTDDPLFSSRRMLHTGTDLLTDKQRVRLQALFGSDDHVEVEATWAIYQRMIAAYREPDRTRSRELMRHLIDSVSHGVPAALTEVITLGRTLPRRAADILAYFDRPGTSNGPTESRQRPPRTPPRHSPRLPHCDEPL